MNNVFLQEEVFVPLVLPIGARDFVRRTVLAGGNPDTELHLYIPRLNIFERRLGWQVPLALLELNRLIGEFIFCEYPKSLFEEKSNQLPQIKQALLDMGYERKFDSISFKMLKLDCAEGKNSPVYHKYPTLIIH